MSPTPAAAIGIVEDSDEDFASFLRVVSRDAPDTKLTRWRRAEDVLASLAKDTTWPNILVVDLNLPGMDGCELVSRLRASAQTRGLPMVILSGSGRQQDIDRCYAAGANAYLTKPNSVAELGALLNMLFSSIAFFRAPSPVEPGPTDGDATEPAQAAAAGEPDVPPAAQVRLDAEREAYEQQLLAERDAAREAAGRAELLQRITSRLSATMTVAQIEQVVSRELAGSGRVSSARLVRPETGDGATVATFERQSASGRTVGLLPLMASGGALIATLRVEVEVDGELDDEHEAFLHTVASLVRGALERMSKVAQLVRQSAGGAPDLPTRKWWTAAIAQSFEEARREGEHLTAVVVELDGFDRYTEAHGHVSADRLLLTVLDAWRRAGVDLLSRTGGEDFAGLVMGKGEREVRELVAGIRRQPSVQQAFSVGLAQWNRAEDGTQLFARAEARLAEDRGRPATS